MQSLTEPTEIELFDLPYDAPLSPIDEGLACIPRGYRPVSTEPDDQNFIERDLYQLNPDDHVWRTENKFFNDLPIYLMKYFANRYKSAFKKAGRAEANKYLREKMKPAKQRALMVLHNYKNLPTTQKVTLLSNEYDDAEQSDFMPKGQMRFDFEQAEKNRKPAKNKLLAELESDELQDMAFTIAKIMNTRYQLISSQAVEKVEADLAQKGIEASESKTGAIAVINCYAELAEFVTQFGIKAPQKRKKQTEITALNDISKMISESWWRGRLTACRKIMREHLAIAMGQVSYKASPYASWDCIREHKDQQRKNWNYIQQRQLLDEETGEEADLAEMVLKSVSNPAIRRHELMVRCRGCEDIGNELNLQGLFLTLTTPSKYHNSYKKGGFIPHWNGASPRAAQEYLNSVWKRIRSKLGREDVRWFGVRVAEPHHDGTPHWHLLIWVKPEDVVTVRRVFIDYAVAEDQEELHPHFDRNEKRAEKKKHIQGPLNYKARCDFGYIDPEKGTATGYIAKYISKNIDGFAMDGEISDETGKSVKDMAKNVSAWKSRWNIRQFQFFGGAPVTTYRELRRFANNDKASFNEYLTQLNYEELLAVYEEMDIRAGRKLVGPPIPVELIRRSSKFNSRYLFVLLTQVYQADLEHENATVAEVMKAADRGQWRDYIMGQGGPFVKREELLITNVYEELPFASAHGETVRKLEGFDASGVFIKTRIKVWTIQKKSTDITDMNGTDGSEATEIGGSAASRSSVNNCTEPPPTQVSDQLIRLLEPDKKQSGLPPDIDNSGLAALLKGRSVRVDDETSIQIRPAEVDELGNTRPAQLIEVQRRPEDDTKWLDFEGWEQLFAQSEQPSSNEYQQPDLSFFPERDGDWPLA